MAVTRYQSLPYQALSDPPDGANGVKNLATAVDSLVPVFVADAATRGNVGATAPDQLIVYQLDTHRMYVYSTGNGWYPVDSTWQGQQTLSPLLGTFNSSKPILTVRNSTNYTITAAGLVTVGIGAVIPAGITITCLTDIQLQWVTRPTANGPIIGYVAPAMEQAATNLTQVVCRVRDAANAYAAVVVGAIVALSWRAGIQIA